MILGGWAPVVAVATPVPPKVHAKRVTLIMGEGCPTCRTTDRAEPGADCTCRRFCKRWMCNHNPQAYDTCLYTEKPPAVPQLCCTNKDRHIRGGSNCR